MVASGLGPTEPVLVLGDASAALPLVWQAEGDFTNPLASAYTGGYPPGVRGVAGDAAADALYRSQCPASAGAWEGVATFMRERGVRWLLIFREPGKPACDLTIARASLGASMTHDLGWATLIETDRSRD
jgi:hypothetical protein